MRRGQTLIEVLIAFAVTVIIGLGLVSAGLATQKAANAARNETQATKLAQEYAEKLRVLRDVKGWNLFISYLDSGSGHEYLLGSTESAIIKDWRLDNLTTTAPCDEGAPSPMRGEKITLDNVDFCRRIYVANYTAGSQSILFRVEVGWKEGSNTRSAKAETNFSRWCNANIDSNLATPCPN